MERFSFNSTRHARRKVCLHRRDQTPASSSHKASRTLASAAAEVDLPTSGQIKLKFSPTAKVSVPPADQASRRTRRTE